MLVGWLWLASGATPGLLMLGFMPVWAAPLAYFS